jgi:hypothetical protein
VTRIQIVNLITKKIHIYLGLLNLSIVLVFGIAGLKATLNRPGQHKPPEPTVRFEDFTVPASVIDDKELGERIRRKLNIAAVIFDTRRDPQNNLVVSYYTHSGPRRVTVLEKENRLRIATQREDIWHFFDNLHGTANRHPSDLRVRLWTYYNEFSVWSLIGMSATGVYLWLASRPGYRWAQMCFAAGSGCFLALYILSR